VRLAALLSPELVITRMRARTKVEAIEELLDCVVQHHPHLDRRATRSMK
jgi:mannitol/fructose-specific phosphotransferase system IIA component (Ntr-type)